MVNPHWGQAGESSRTRHWQYGQCMSWVGSAGDYSRRSRQVEQNVGKIVRCGNFPVEGNNEHTLPETGNVLEDFTQVGNVHFDDGNCRDSNSSGTLKTKVTVELSSNDRGQHGWSL